MIELLHYDFIRNALVTGILAAIICGFIGPFIVVRRLVFISGGISHIAFGGLGLFYFLGLDPFLGALTAAVLTGLFIMPATRNLSRYNDARIGIFWALGMAVGILFISKTPGYAPNLITYLFGNILTVSRQSLVITLALTLIVTAAIFIFYKEFVSISFDLEFSRVQGLPVSRLNSLLMLLISITIVALIQVVGIILVIAMLTIPTLIALQFARHFSQVILISVLSGILMSIIGLFLSFYLDMASGPVIIISGAVGLGLISLIRKFRTAARD